MSHAGRLYGLGNDGRLVVAEISYTPDQRNSLVRWVTIREDMSETMRPAITGLLAGLDRRNV
jgi:hypothetical protein